MHLACIRNMGEPRILLGSECTTSVSGPGVPWAGGGQHGEATPQGRVCGWLQL